jgi:RimJ/RimL family protein N-acetyltransferase
MKDLFYWANNPEAIGEFDVFNVSQWHEVEKWFKEPDTAHEFTTLLIERNEDKAKLGIAVHYFAHPILRNIEVGFQIWDKKERNKGYATEALKLLIEYLFTTKNITRIQATTHTKNIAAQHVLEKCGFKKEGCQRKAIFTNGEFQDTYIYRILREEWKTTYAKK